MTTAMSPPPLQLHRGDRAPECPYVGLVPFDEHEAAFFFGRDREAEMIVANLTAARLTLLYAPSGVGKSSVLRAGVLPRLRRLGDDDLDEEGIAQTTAAVAYVSDWSANPLEAMGEAIRAAVAHATGGAPPGAPSPLGVGELRHLLDECGVAVLYLILDQFEEYFFYHPSDSAPGTLTAELSEILAARDLDVHVLISIREDALAGLDRFKGRVPNLFGNRLGLAHLDRAAAMAAIHGPMAEYNRRVPADAAMDVDPQLVDDLLDQVRAGNVAVESDDAATASTDGVHSEHIEAPYLQLVLTRIWEQERAQGSRVLRAASLEKLGGAQKIVRSHLATVVAELTPDQVPIAAAVFHHLVTASGSKIAYSASDLADVSGQPEADVRALLEALSAGRRRILRPVPPAAGSLGPPRYEIFHDVMGKAVLEWRRGYVAEERRREESARLVAEREQARADALVARRKLRSTWLCVGLVVALLLAAGSFYALMLASNGRKQQALLAQAAAALERNPDLSRSRAVEAYGYGHTPEARSALLVAASAPHSSVVVGPADAASTLIGMKVAADGTVVGYARGGRLVVVRSGAIKELTVSGLRSAVVDVAPAPDASRVAVATDQGQVAVIDVASGRRTELATGLKVGSTVEWLGDAATGSVLVVGSNHAAATFNSLTGAVLGRFPDTYAAAGIDGGRYVVTSQSDKRLRVWDATVAGPPRKQSDAFNGPPKYFAQDGPRIVAVTNFTSTTERPDMIVVWDWQSANAPVTNTFSATNGVQAVALNTASTNPALHSVIVAEGKVVWEFYLGDGRLREVLPGQSDWVSDVAVSANGDWAVTAGGDGQVLVWSERGDWFPVRPTYELPGDGGSVAQAAFLGDDVIALEDNGTLRRWSLDPPSRFVQHNDWVLGSDVSHDGRMIATASADGDGYILDPADPTRFLAWFGGGYALAHVRFDPIDRQRVYTLARYAPDAPQAWRWSPGDKKSPQPVSADFHAH
jgi:WD40 repeat protein